MNRLLSLIGAILFVFAIFACGNSDETPCDVTSSSSSSSSSTGVKWCPNEKHSYMILNDDEECVFWACELIWGNCDNDVSNGCETVLAQDHNCGGCGVVCEAETHCVSYCGGNGCWTGCQ